jgi:hypothetical protein
MLRTASQTSSPARTHPVGVLPPLAVGRLERPADTTLQTAVGGDGAAAAVVCQVLAGLGGLGKTQLAAGLAQQHRADLLVWVAAASRTAVLTRYAQTAADVTGVEDPDPVDSAQRFLAWLASTAVTTRRRDAALLDGRILIDVGLFPKAAGGPGPRPWRRCVSSNVAVPLALRSGFADVRTGCAAASQFGKW